MKYDKEEKDILDAYESGSLKISTPSKKKQNVSKELQKILLKKISGSRYVSMTMIIKEFRRKQWKWGYLIKRLYPALSTDTSKVN